MKKLTSVLGCGAAFSFWLAAGTASAQTEPRKPLENYFEIGLFGGALWPSNNIALYSRAHETFNSPVPELGARVAYFPLSFLGAELEGAAGATKTESGSAADLWAARAHGILQFPGLP